MLTASVKDMLVTSIDITLETGVVPTQYIVIISTVRRQSEVGIQRRIDVSPIVNFCLGYLVKKFEMFMVIFTNGRRRVFFKKQFFISASRTIHLTLNLQARNYRNINYYNIYTFSFTQYYLSMLRNLKKLKVVYYCIQIYCEMF